MKRFLPNLSDLFATWASAGQYGSVEELGAADEAELPSSKVHVLHKHAPARHRDIQTVGVPSSGDPNYFTGSMLVKTKLG